MTNFICAIHIDHDFDSCMNIVQESHLHVLYEKMYQEMKISLDTEIPFGTCTKEGFDSWLQEVCNLFDHCNVMYKINFIEKGCCYFTQDGFCYSTNN